MPQIVQYETPSLSMQKQFGYWLEQAGMLVVLFLLVAYCSIMIPGFFSLRNLDSLLLAVTTVGIISCTMLFCLASGNFDLSVGTIAPCAGVVAAVMMNGTPDLAAWLNEHISLGPINRAWTYLLTNQDPVLRISMGVGAALLTGALVGMTNGLVVAKMKINPLITTLATMQIVKGIGLRVSDGHTVGITRESFFALGNGAWPIVHDKSGGLLFQISAPVWICFACLLVFGFLLSRTTFGRNTLAIGGNEEAARLAGINVDRIKIAIFVIQGVIAALAGIILAARLTMAQQNQQQGLELQVISACVLGGVSLTGGIGKMSFVIAGVFIMGVVQNAMNLSNVNSDNQYIVSGCILLGAVMLDRLKQR